MELYYQNDTILHLTTGAFIDPEVGYKSFMNYVSMQDCSEPGFLNEVIVGILGFEVLSPLMDGLHDGNDLCV
jgi:hypothetical protein